MHRFGIQVPFLNLVSAMQSVMCLNAFMLASTTRAQNHAPLDSLDLVGNDMQPVVYRMIPNHFWSPVKLATHLATTYRRHIFFSV